MCRPARDTAVAARLTTYVVVAIVAATLIAGLMVGAQRDDNDGPVDLIVFNAKVYTADSSGSMAEAVAVRGNQILRVGSNREINRLKRPQTLLIDARGAAVLPGFSDASTHFIDGGLALENVDLTDATTIEEIQARIRIWSESYPDRPWIVARGWQPAALSAPPTRQLLDAAATDRPVAVFSRDGRSVWLNSKAIQRAGITRRTETPADGSIIKDSRTGLPTGVLKGTAIALATKVLPQATREERIRALHEAIEDAHREGVTTVHDTLDRADDFLLYDDARSDGDLAVRVYASVSADNLPQSEVLKQVESLAERYPDDPLFKMGGVRISLDGPVESQDAALLEPYANHGDYQGSDRVDPDALNKLVRLLDRDHRQVTIAGRGDKAVRMALNAFEHAVKSNPAPPRGRRHRLEGLALVDAIDVPRVGRLGTIVTMRPDEMMPTSERLEALAKGLGPERLSRVWPAASLVSARAQLAFAVDSPLDTTPLAAIQTAITRATPEGFPENGSLSAERVSLKRAINAFTSVPAFASFDEQRKGSLKKGMLADLVVLSDDIFSLPATDLDRVIVAATIFDGKIVYQRRASTTN